MRNMRKNWWNGAFFFHKLEPQLSLSLSYHSLLGRSSSTFTQDWNGDKISQNSNKISHENFCQTSLYCFIFLFLFYRKYNPWKGTDQFVSCEIKNFFSHLKLFLPLYYCNNTVYHSTLDHFWALMYTSFEIYTFVSVATGIFMKM